MPVDWLAGMDQEQAGQDRHRLEHPRRDNHRDMLLFRKTFQALIPLKSKSLN
jgi:hypothetical protein